MDIVENIYQNIINHINSAIDIFNCRCDMNKFIHKVKEILKIKYNLIIKNTNHLKLDITKEINTIRMVAFLACENIFIV